MRLCMLCLTLAASLWSTHAADVWWQSAVVYQIYPRSFKDSDGDGIGDLNGITSKLDYLKGLGVDAIWLSPIYESPMYDFGYDIADYKAIEPKFGTMEDFDTLLATANSKDWAVHARDFVQNSGYETKPCEDNFLFVAVHPGIRIILDFVPNHTSHLSKWFIESAKKNETYYDYYIWADGTTVDGVEKPPNNWISMFGGSAWEYSPVREQYYLHQFAVQQPDINYRNADLRKEMQDVLRFWLNKGVSGFRVDAVNFLYEDVYANGTYPDEPVADSTSYTSDQYEYLNHIYTKDKDATYEIVYDWREVLDEFTTESKIMMTEAYTDLDHMVRYYSSGTREGSIPFNFIFLEQLTSTSKATDMKTVIDKWMTSMPAGKTANWVNGNHDQSRLATRHGENRVDAMNMLAMLLPGVTITYQGEELGMTDGTVTWEQTVDPQACNTNDPENFASKSRDPERTPFHWDATSFAGFTNGTSTWLPVASNYQTVNVAVEELATKSHLKFYKDIVTLKHTSPVSSGDLTTDALSDTVMVVTRTVSDDAVVGVINLASTSQDVSLSSLSKVPQKLVVAASGVACSLEKETKLEKDSITMPAYCALALRSSSSTFKTTTASFVVYCVLYILYTVA